MKKNYALLSALVLVGSMTFAQDLQKKFIDQQVPVKPTKVDAPIKGSIDNSKAPGDTLYYEDFGTGGPGGANFPLGWTQTNNAGNNNNWIWDTQAPAGQYSTGAAAFASTSAANGFLSLPSDLYNTPTPPGGFINMDATVSSPAISITPSASVLLSYQQYHVFCCDANAALTIEVSSDGINWDSYDASGGRGSNTITPNPEIYTVNVSQTLAFQSTAYIRFTQTAASAYWWMIDDVALVEGNANNMVLEDYAVNFVDTFDITPLYTIVPECISMPMSFEGATFNAGSNVQTDVHLRGTVNQNTAFGGGPGVGLVWQDSVLLGATVPSLQRDTDLVTGYINTIAGAFTATVDVVSDSINQDPAGATASYSYQISDTVLARDDGGFGGGTGPGNYAGGGNDGDKFATLFTVGKQGAEIVSLDMYIANNTENDGVQIVPKVWRFDQDSATLTGALTTVVAENLIPTTITSAMFDTWVTFDFSFGTGSVNLPPGQYAMGWEQVNGATNNLTFRVGRDRTTEPITPRVSIFVFVNDAAATWGWVGQVPAVRANFKKDSRCTVGLEDEASITENAVGFEVAPNPNEGQFGISISTDKKLDYTLNVRNMLGQIVMTQQVSVNKSKTMQMDLSDYEKGVYFVSLENGDERLVKKVVVK